MSTETNVVEVELPGALLESLEAFAAKWNKSLSTVIVDALTYVDEECDYADVAPA